jgi:hypothetical protein
VLSSARQAMWVKRALKSRGLILAFAGAAVLLFGGYFCWVDRDAVDSLPSDGPEAYARFWAGFKTYLWAGLPLCAAGAYLWRRTSNNGMHPTAGTTNVM